MPAFKKVKRSTGGKPIISEKIIKEICDCLRAGSYLETAAACVGIHKDTLHKWLKKGRSPRGNIKEDSLYGKLIIAVEKAQAEAEVRDLFNIDKCANGQDWEYERDENGRLVLNSRGNPIPLKIGIPPNWQASAWRLERKFRDRWGRVDRHELTGKDGEAITTDNKTQIIETPEAKQERKKRIDEFLRVLQTIQK